MFINGLFLPTDDIGIHLIQVGGLFVIISIPLTHIAYFVTGRYFDNTLGFKNAPDLVAELLPFSFLCRTIHYCLLIVIHRSAKKSYDRKVYGDTDFRKLARTRDKIMAFPLVILGFGGFAILWVGAIIHFIFWLVSLL